MNSSLERMRNPIDFGPFVYQSLTPGDSGKTQKQTFRRLIASKQNFVLVCVTYCKFQQIWGWMCPSTGASLVFLKIVPLCKMQFFKIVYLDLSPVTLSENIVIQK